jgi:hypothetical protein
VAGQHDHGLPAGHVLEQELRILQAHPIAHDLARRAEAVQGFGGEHAEVAIGLPEQPRDLRLILLRKRPTKIVGGEIATPAQDLEHDDVREPADDIEDRKRYPAEHIQQQTRHRRTELHPAHS